MARGLVIALAVVAGTAAGAVAHATATGALAASVTAVSLALLTDERALGRALVLVAISAAAMANGARARDRALAPPLVTWFAGAFGPGERADEAAVVEGTIAADAEPADAGARVVVNVRAVIGADGRHEIDGVIDLHVDGERATAAIGEWVAGRTIRAPAVLRHPEVWLDPGTPSVAWQTLRRPFDLTGSVKSAALVSVTRGAWWDELAARARANVRRAAARLFPGARAESAAIVAAILIGDRAGLDPDLIRRMQAAGTYHVIAISGGNVALVAMLCLGGLRWFVRSFRTASIATMAGVAVYGWIVGADPSVERAVTAACIYIAADLVGLAPPSLNVLGFVALMLAAIDPLVVVDVGAWLSFGATLGIIVFANRFFSGLGPTLGREHSMAWRIAAAALGLLGATLAAELVLLPVSATIFHRVGVAGLLLNFVAIPAMAVVQIAGGIGVLLVNWWGTAASVAAFIADMAARALVFSSRLVDVVTWLSWRVPAPSALTVVVFYAAGLLTLIAERWTPRRIAAAIVCAASGVVIASAPGIRLAAPPSPWLRFTMIDVGQGDALLLQFPTGQSLVVDAGSAAGGFDLGDRIVTPALWASGVTHLEWLAFTHADMDHIGGTASVAKVFSPREIWEGVPVPRDPKRQALRVVANARGAAWRELQRGDKLDVGPVRMSVLSPPIPDWERQRVRNDDSIVLRLTYGDVELLLTGDISEVAEHEILTDDDRRPLRILKVAHHGSRGSSSPDFVRAYAPQVALVSVGRGNLFGHPSPDVIDRLRSEGAEIFRTDQDGAIILETDGHEAHVRTMTGRAWNVRVWSSPA